MPPRTRLLPPTSRASLRPIRNPHSHIRPLSLSAASRSIDPAKTIPPPSPRWLSDLRARVGKCIMFGCDAKQTAAAGAVLRALATEWRQLTAGSEGFLGGPGRESWENHKVMWGEQDTFKHVNNVAYVRYAESSRCGWVTNMARHVDPAHRREWEALLTPSPIGLILKRITVEYKSVLTYPDTISVYHKYIPGPSTTEMHLGFLILSHKSGRVAAKGDEDVVVYDHVKGAKTDMPRWMREQFEITASLQEVETVRARTRIRDLGEMVRALEKDSWDKEGAVEDVGQKK